MTTSRALVFSVCLSGLVFSTAALFLAAIGARPVTIQVEDKPLFSGQVQDLAPPYLSIVTGLSVGVGLTTFALFGWRAAARQLDQSAEQLSALKQRLQQQEGMVESLKFSEAKLQAAGLGFFLDGLSNHGAAQAPLHAASLQPSLPAKAFSNPSAQTPSPSMPSASFGHHQPVDTRLAHSAQSHHPAKIDELMNSLQQIMHQVEQLKMAQKADHNDSMDTSVRF